MIKQEQPISHLQEQFKILIKNKIQSSNPGKLQYNWTKAQLSLLPLMKQPQQNISSHLIMTAINNFESTCILKMIPPFYSYYFILATVKHNQILSAIHSQIDKISNGRSQYQDIAVQLMLMQEVIANVSKKIEGRQDVDLGQLRQIVILVILKINQWQQSMTAWAKHPVFFMWKNQPFLPGLSKNNQFTFQLTNQKYQLHNNPLLLPKDKSLSEDKTILQCLNILKSQSGLQLELILNHPSFITLQINDSSAANADSPHLTNQKKMQFINKIGIKKQTKSKELLALLSKDELAVIRKFRSLKKITKPINAHHPQLDQKQKIINHGISVKLTDLKNKIQVSCQIRKNRQFSSSSQTKPMEQTLRIIMQKQTNLDPKRPQVHRQHLQQLYSKQKIIKTDGGCNLKKTTEEQKLHTIKIQSEIMKRNLIKKQEEIEKKNNSLKLLKLDLLQKVKLKNRITSKTNNSKQTKDEQVKAKSFPKKKRQQQQIHAEVDQNLKQISQVKEELAYKNKQTQNCIIQTEKQLIVKQRQRYAMQQKLKIKRDNVHKLQIALSTTQSKDKLTDRDKLTDKDKLVEEVTRLKMKKQMQYQYQKQKIEEIGLTLQERVKQQQNKYEQLKRIKQEHQIKVQLQYQRQIQRAKQQLQIQTQQMKNALLKEQEKRKQFQSKIAKQKQKNQQIQQQIREWELKEQQLLLEVQQQMKIRQQQEEQYKQTRKRMLQQQIQEMEEKQNQIINQYRTSNNNLIHILQALKNKNHQLERVVAQI